MKCLTEKLLFQELKRKSIAFREDVNGTQRMQTRPRLTSLPYLHGRETSAQCQSDRSHTSPMTPNPATQHEEDEAFAKEHAEHEAFAKEHAEHEGATKKHAEHEALAKEHVEDEGLAKEHEEDEGLPRDHEEGEGLAKQSDREVRRLGKENE